MAAPSSMTSASGDPRTGRRIIVLVPELDIRVLGEEGELLRHLTLDPTRDCQSMNARA